MKINIEDYPPDRDQPLLLKPSRAFLCRWAFFTSILAILFSYRFLDFLAQLLNGNLNTLFPVFLFSIFASTFLTACVIFLSACFNSNIGSITLSNNGLSMQYLKKAVLCKWTDITEIEYKILGVRYAQPMIIITTNYNKSYRLWASLFPVPPKELTKLLASWHQYFGPANSKQ